MVCVQMVGSASFPGVSWLGLAFVAGDELGEGHAQMWAPRAHQELSLGKSYNWGSCQGERTSPLLCLQPGDAAMGGRGQGCGPGVGAGGQGQGEELDGCPCMCTPALHL